MMKYNVSKLIAIDCRLLDRKKNTGISRYTDFLIDYYTNKFGVNNIVLISNKSIEKFYGNVLITNLRPFNLFHFFIFPFFIKKNDIKNIHIPHYSGLFFKLSPIKIILTVHDLMFINVKHFFSNNIFINYLGKCYYRIIVFFSIKSCDALIAVSNTTKNDLNSFFNCSATVIPENSDLLIVPSDDVLLENDLINSNFFLYVGNSRPHKNVEFIRIIFEADSSLPQLVLCGPGHSPSTKNVKVLGVVDDSSLVALYKRCSALIFPSIYEGFGLPVIEALRHGKQVVLSRIPAFLEFSSCPSLHFFDLNDIEQFKSALNASLVDPKSCPIEFLNNYSNISIHKKLDNLSLIFAS